MQRHLALSLAHSRCSINSSCMYQWVREPSRKDRDQFPTGQPLCGAWNQNHKDQGSNFQLLLLGGWEVLFWTKGHTCGYFCCPGCLSTCVTGTYPQPPLNYQSPGLGREGESAVGGGL